MRKRLGLAVLAASLACGGAHATTPKYSAIYSFGDSLSDVGNDLKLSFGAVPPAPYFEGRFSNGPNWLDDLTAKLGLGTSATASLNGGNDFAFGGAQTGMTDVNGLLLVPTLDDQVDDNDEFKGVTPIPGALYTLDIGANDILNAVTDFKNKVITFAEMTAAILTEAVQNTLNAVKDLYADGMRSLLYYEVPDLSKVPAYEAIDPTDAGMLAKEFNTDVLKGIATLDLSGLTVFDLPIFSAFDEIVADPTAFGLNLTNVTDPCFTGSPTMSGNVCADPDQYLFWDSEHPTEVVQAAIANLAFDELSGVSEPLTVPEPSTWAMMLIGFGGLGLAGWRARQARAARTA